MIQYNLNTFLIELERAKVGRHFSDGKISFFGFWKLRLALWRLSNENLAAFSKTFNVEMPGYSLSELQRAQKTIRYAVEDWMLFDFKQKTLYQLIEE